MALFNVKGLSRMSLSLVGEVGRAGARYGARCMEKHAKVHLGKHLCLGEKDAVKDTRVISMLRMAQCSAKASNRMSL